MAASAGPTAAALPVVGERAPDSPELGLPRGKPTLVVFLRPCGDAFAEKMLRDLAALSEDRPALACVAVVQASRAAADRWVAEVGGAWDAEVVADPSRALYARWGLGLSSSWQMYNPRALYATYALGRREGIWSRWTVGASTPADGADRAPADTPPDSTPPAHSTPNRWQLGGAFAVDAAGIVRWVQAPQAADALLDPAPVLDVFGLPPLPPKRAPRRSPSPVAIPEGRKALYQ